MKSALELAAQILDQLNTINQADSALALATTTSAAELVDQVDQELAALLAQIDNILAVHQQTVHDMTAAHVHEIEQAIGLRGAAVAAPQKQIEAALALVAKLRPPAGWDPTQRVTKFPRPEGAEFVTWESLYHSGDTISQTFRRCPAGKKVSMPEGEFILRDFLDVNTVSLQIGTAGATGCIGFRGMGDGTHFSLAPMSSTKKGIQYNNTRDSSGTNQTRMICIQGVTNGEIGQISLSGSQQDHYYGGIYVYGSPGTLIHHIGGKNINPGFANYPPGETFGVGTYQSNNVSIEDCEFDGRDGADVPTSASPIGFNLHQNATVKRCWTHHAIAGMPTFWKVDGTITTEDLWTKRNGSGNDGGRLGGTGINHEQSTGVANHLRPNLQIEGAYSDIAGPKTANTDQHMTLDGNRGDLKVTVTDPVFDGNAGGPGVFTFHKNLTYEGQPNLIKTAPVVKTSTGATVPSRVFS